MDQKTLVALFQSMGIGDVRNHMSAVEADVVERVKRHLERQKAPEVVEERIRPTVVKRRARGAEGETSGPEPTATRAAAPAVPPARACFMCWRKGEHEHSPPATTRRHRSEAERHPPAFQLDGPLSLPGAGHGRRRLPSRRPSPRR